jgi:hypothetical protein
MFLESVATALECGIRVGATPALVVAELVE